MTQRLSTRPTTRVLALSAVTALSGLTLIATAGGPARAATSPEKAYVVPATGENVSYPSIQLPITACPAGAGAFAAVLLGPGFPAEGQLVKGQGLLSEITSTGGLFGLQYSFQDAATDAGTTLQAATSYTVSTFCQDGIGAPLGDTYNAVFTIVSAGAVGTYSAETAPTTPPPTTPPPTTTAPPTTTPPPTTTAPPTTTPPPTTTAPPTTTPPPTTPEPYEAEVGLINAAGEPLAQNPELTPGQVLTVKGGGFEPGETVTLALALATDATPTPTPTTAALAAEITAAAPITVTANSVGNVDAAYTIPTDLAAGSYVLTLAGANQTLTTDLRVLAPGATPSATDVPDSGVDSAADTDNSGDLPLTGTATIGLTLAGLGLAAGGTVLVVAGQRRRRGLHAR